MKAERTAKGQILFVMTESEYGRMSEDYAGVCLGCGEVHGGIEPDARGYRCGACDASRVYGLEEAMLLGRVKFAEPA